MHKIPMVDLKGQYNKIQNEIDTAVIEAIRSTAFINGPEVSGFAKELAVYLGVKNVIPCANGTDALQIALMALDLKPGDEVITPSFTYIATVEVIALLGLTPKFVEINPSTYNLDVSQVEKLITEKTKAIVPVHLYGQCADMEPLLEISKKHNIPIVEDTAQAIGADYIFEDGKTKKAGTIGTIGCTSFFPSKNLGCYGDGGAIFTNDDKLAKKIKMCANHGQSQKYQHDIIGVNSRLDTVQAAILRVKLPHLDSYSAARNYAANYYTERFDKLAGIIPPSISKNSTHVFHQYTVQLEEINQNEFREFLAQKGIPTNIYYPIPVHLQKGYQEYGYKKGDLKVTEHMCENTVSLPIHTEMGDNVLEYICKSVEEFINS